MYKLLNYCLQEIYISFDNVMAEAFSELTNWIKNIELMRTERIQTATFCLVFKMIMIFFKHWVIIAKGWIAWRLFLKCMKSALIFITFLLGKHKQCSRKALSPSVSSAEFMSRLMLSPAGLRCWAACPSCMIFVYSITTKTFNRQSKCQRIKMWRVAPSLWEQKTVFPSLSSFLRALQFYSYDLTYHFSFFKCNCLRNIFISIYYDINAFVKKETNIGEHQAETKMHRNSFGKKKKQ